MKISKGRGRQKGDCHDYNFWMGRYLSGIDRRNRFYLLARKADAMKIVSIDEQVIIHKRNQRTFLRCILWNPTELHKFLSGSRKKRGSPVGVPLVRRQRQPENESG